MDPRECMWSHDATQSRMRLASIEICAYTIVFKVISADTDVQKAPPQRRRCWNLGSPRREIGDKQNPPPLSTSHSPR
jgi:hypothetical protein